MVEQYELVTIIDLCISSLPHSLASVRGESLGRVEVKYPDCCKIGVPLLKTWHVDSIVLIINIVEIRRL